VVAVYPNAVKKFSYRQDYTQLVEAADVNVLYDEVAATQTTLGVLPNTDTIDGKVNTWPTVKANIAAARSGVSKPYCYVSAHNFLVSYQGKNYINFTNKSWDTHGMWGGGSTLTCPRDGVYTFDVYIRWHSDALSADGQQPVFNRSGPLEISLTPVGGSGDLVHQDGYYPQGWQRSTHQSASITAPWLKGQGIQAWAAQYCLTTPLTATAFVAITYHRSPPTTNNL
jgi:hypothetical protein